MHSTDVLKPWLQDDDVLVIDGGLSTALEQRGIELNGDLWTGQVLLDDPSEVQAAHTDYLEAGADVVITASYQLSFDNLKAKGMSDETAAGVLIWSTEVALRARDRFVDQNDVDRRPLVASSIGPYGAVLADGSEYRGDYGLSVEELKLWHQPRFEVLSHSGADLLACETIPSFVEVQALLQLIAEGNRPAWLSLSCKSPDTLADGTPLAEVAELCCDLPNLVAVGVNCLPPDWVPGALTILGRVVGHPLLAYPNAGGAYDPARHRWQGSTIEWTGLAPTWRELGARLIGGCCQSSPEDIRTLRRSLRPS